MTEEQIERLKQIRERHRLAVFAYKGDKPPIAVSDIDFLLSLLDRQAAGRPIGWISCGLRHGHDRIVDIVFENADCAKEFIDGVEPVAGPIVAATSMRSRCVEKVRTLSDEWNTAADKAYSRRDLSAEVRLRTKRDCAEEIVTALESLPT